VCVAQVLDLLAGGLEPGTLGAAAIGAREEKLVDAHGPARQQFDPADEQKIAFVAVLPDRQAASTIAPISSIDAIFSARFSRASSSTLVPS
jgi:hypothetical protein